MLDSSKITVRALEKPITFFRQNKKQKKTNSNYTWVVTASIVL